jgi:hypothetical protein
VRATRIIPPSRDRLFRTCCRCSVCTSGIGTASYLTGAFGGGKPFIQPIKGTDPDGSQFTAVLCAAPLGALDPVWDELFPVEQARILQLLMARVAVRLDGLEIILRVERITSLIDDLRLHQGAERQAA